VRQKGFFRLFYFIYCEPANIPTSFFHLFILLPFSYLLVFSLENGKRNGEKSWNVKEMKKVEVTLERKVTIWDSC